MKDVKARIRHVIMTVSRVLAITAGAGGIFAGVYFSRLSDFGALKKRCVSAQRQPSHAVYLPTPRIYKPCCMLPAALCF